MEANVSDSKFLRTLQSRKFWAGVIGLLSILWIAYQSGTAIDAEKVIDAIMVIVAAYIGATAWEDGKQAEAVGRMVAGEGKGE
jgi:hypothetical protein